MVQAVNLRPAGRKLPSLGVYRCLIVIASRSHPGLDPKRVHFWSSFSFSGSFRRSFSHPRDSRESFLAYFSFLGALWERWGPTFSSQKRFGPPKAPQWDFPPNPLTFLESFFVILSVFWVLFLSIVFCWVLRPIFHGCWLHFDTIFLYVFGFVRTSGFSGFWQPFHSKTRFLQVQGY